MIETVASHPWATAMLVLAVIAGAAGATLWVSLIRIVRRFK